jgi:hypothetical protein
MVSLAADRQWMVFLPFLAFECVYAVALVTLARRRGIEPG